MEGRALLECLADLDSDLRGKGLRYASFQAAAFLTTTGFATTDYTRWPALAQIVMYVLMFIGGCAGSTGGGNKVVRIAMLFKQAITEMRYQLFPRGIFPVHLGGEADYQAAWR